MKIILEHKTAFFVLYAILPFASFHFITNLNFGDLVFDASIIFAVGLLSPKSMSQQMEDFINELLDQGVDLTVKSNKRNAGIKFCDSHNIDRKKGLDLFFKLLKKVLKKRGFVVSDFIPPRSKKPKTDLKANITPKPKSKDLRDTVEAEARTGAIGEKTDGKLEKKKIKKLVYDKDGKSIGEAEVEVFTSQDGTRVYHDWEHFDEEGVSASINAFYITIRVAYPELESLSLEEKKSLGKMWVPAFKRYLTENWAYIGIPFLATMGMFMPKLVAARSKKKSLGDSKESEKATEEEKKDKNEKES